MFQSKNIFQKKDFIIIAIICYFLGFLLIRQLYFSDETQRIKKGEEEQLLALEISRLIRANADLRLEIQELSATAEKYRRSLEDKKSASEEVSKNLEKYKIIAGTTRIYGSGVEVKIDSDVTKEQMVDLVNSLKNIGIEGISINGKRLAISSYFTADQGGLFMNGQRLEKPYTIWVIGNAPLIKEALERKGGIIEQLQLETKGGQIKIEERNEVVLGAL